MREFYKKEVSHLKVNIDQNEVLIKSVHLADNLTLFAVSVEGVHGVMRAVLVFLLAF